MECEPIGTVSTPFQTTTAAPSQGRNDDVEGVVHVDAAYRPAMEGIDPGDDVVVVWFADRADRILQVRDTGVFATRSPARPNPICLTTCRVLDVASDHLRVRGVDMADGSPVLDLKRTLD